MRKELAPVLLAAALVGSACQRPPDQTAINAAVEATLTARSGIAEPAGTPDVSPIPQSIPAKPAQSETTQNPEQEFELFRSSDPPYEIMYPKGWEVIRNYKQFIDPQSRKKPYLTEVSIGHQPLKGELFEVKGDFVEEAIKNRNKWLHEIGSKETYKVIPLSINAGKGVLLTARVPWRTSEFDHAVALFTSESVGYWISLTSDPSETSKVWSKFETMLKTFKVSQIPQLAESPSKAPPPPRAEAQKPSPSPDSRTETGWTRFKSLDLPYQLDYPSNWRQAGNRFYGETTKANPTLFQVTSTPMPDWITLDDFKDQTIKQFIDTVKVLGAGIDLKQTPNQTIGGQKAWRLDSTVSSSQTTPNVSVIYLTTKDGKAWAVQFAADASVFNQELPKFQKMVASFKFLK